MSTSYPEAIDQFTTKTDGVSVVAAADINNLQDAVVAIQTALGPNPAPPPPAFSDSISYVTWKDDFVGARRPTGSSRPGDLHPERGSGRVRYPHPGSTTTTPPSCASVGWASRRPPGTRRSRSSPGSRAPPRSTRSWPASTTMRTTSSRSTTTRKAPPRPSGTAAAAAAWRPRWTPTWRRTPTTTTSGCGSRPTDSPSGSPSTAPRPRRPSPPTFRACSWSPTWA